MKVTAKQLGKRYDRDWIIRGLDYDFLPANSYAILGPNGSGKSTLMQLLSANLIPTEGALLYEQAGKQVAAEEIFSSLSFCAPYLQLIEEFSLQEQLSFHRRFKPFVNGLNEHSVIELLGMERHQHQEIRQFSSGMKQRVKLVLAVLSDVPMVLLDEPATNLDEDGVNWYRNLVKEFTHDRLLLVSSNRADEYDFCRHQLHISSWR